MALSGTSHTSPQGEKLLTRHMFGCESSFPGWGPTRVPRYVTEDPMLQPVLFLFLS